MDPQKLAFLTALMNDAQKQNKDNLMPFIMAAASRANSEGMNFSDEESRGVREEERAENRCTEGREPGEG